MVINTENFLSATQLEIRSKAALLNADVDINQSSQVLQLHNL